MREHKATQERRGTAGGAGGPGEAEEVVLTRTDRAGNTRPVEMGTRSEPSGGKRKRKKVGATPYGVQAPLAGSQTRVRRVPLASRAGGSLRTSLKCEFKF